MRIAVLGTGAMGGAIAEALLGSVDSLTVYNRTAEKTEALARLGASVSQTPAAAIDGADAVICALLDHAATKTVIDGLPVQARALPLLMVSVVTPAECDDLHATCADRNIRLSDAAIAAYPDDVRAGKAELLVGPDAADADFWAGLLARLGSVQLLDNPGDGVKVYMAASAAYMFQPLAVGYTMALAMRMGLPLSVAGSRIEKSAGASLLLRDMAARRYGTDQFSIDAFIAMSDQIIASAASAGIPVGPLEAVRSVFRSASEHGLGKYDVSAILEELDGNAGAHATDAAAADRAGSRG